MREFGLSDKAAEKLWVWKIRRLYPALFFALVMLLAFWKPLFHHEFTLLSGGDLCAQTFPWFNVAAHWIKKLVLLIWDPYVYSGKANLGELQPGILYPINWIFMLMRSKGGGVNLDGLQGLIILNYFLAAYFCFVLARSLGLHFPGAAVAGIGFALGGYSSQLHGWVNIFGSFVWMPLVICLFRKALLASERALQVKWLLWSAFCMALSFLAGHHSGAIHTGCLILSWTLFMFIREWKVAGRSKRTEVPIFLVLLVVSFAMFAAVQWLPSAQWARHVYRWVGGSQVVRSGQSIPYSVLQQTDSLSPQDGVSLLMPYFTTSSNIYTGIVILFLALAGLLHARKTEASFFGIMVFVYFFISWGKLSALHGWLYTFVPGMWFARETYLFLVPMQLCIAMLAGYGLDCLIEAYSGESQRSLKAFLKRSGWGMAFLVLCSGVFIVAAHVFKDLPWNHPYLTRAGSLATYASVLGILLFMLHRKSFRPLLFGWLVIALAALDLSSHLSTVIVDSRQPLALRQYWQVPQAALFLKSLREREIFRVDDPLRAFPPNFGDAWLLEETLGHGATGLIDYFEFRGTGWGPASNATALLNARYIVSSVPIASMKEVFEEGGYKVYRNPRAVPRAFVTTRYRSFSHGQEILDWIRSPLFSPGRTVILNEKEMDKLPAGLRSNMQNEAEGIGLKPFCITAGEKQAETTADEQLRNRLNLLHAPWGWSTGDEARISLEPKSPIRNCFLIVNYYPTGSSPSPLNVSLTGYGIEKTLSISLEGLPAGTQEASTPRQVTTDLGMLGLGEYLVSVNKTAECSANIDLLQVTLSPPPPEGDDAGSATISALEPNHIKLQASLKRTGFVVISQVDYPGWEAFVDGSAAPLLRADYVLQAIPVSAGRHQIELRFRSRVFLVGLCMSLIALSALSWITIRFRVS